MTPEDRKTDSVLKELVDELRVQAWLARKEVSEPSHATQDADDDVRKKTKVLARMRDELRVQLHLGQLEASEEWTRLEGRWSYLMRNEVVVPMRAVVAALGETADDVLDDIRVGYDRLRGSEN